MPLVFGYGSLVNRRLRGPYLQEWPTRFLAPFRRSWNAHCISHEGVKYTALGLQMCHEKRTVNGVVFEVTPERYGHLLEREKGYRVHMATLDEFDWLGGEKPLNGPVSVFITERPNVPTQEYSVNPRYLQNCVQGFQELGPGALEEFYESLLF